MAFRLPPFRWPLDRRQWEDVYRKITDAAAFLWDQIDKSGASIGDIPNRGHNLLTNILGWASGSDTTQNKHISEADGKVWQDHVSSATHVPPLPTAALTDGQIWVVRNGQWEILNIS